MVSRYDKQLIAMAAVLLAGALAGLHPAVAFQQGLAAGSAASTLVLYEAVFRNPPTEPARHRNAALGIVGLGWLATLVLAL
ncbi:hypothetical protein [Halorubrum halophilum]|uniref:hypothetical protein n=1 Tax=Halorubrum halophilum TaxID=413816 RepID=UPI000679902A|nr:hypothetical protein [Halorubrum halophilum]